MARPVAIGYRRVSTFEQEASGLGLEAQQRALELEAGRRGWNLAEVLEDVASAGSLRQRPGLTRALELAREHQGILMVSRLDRLSRSVGDFAAIMARAEEEGWQLVVLDPNVDMTTPYGRAMAGMASVFAQLERELIGQRTREGLRVARNRGARLGRPSSFTPEQEAEVMYRADVRGESATHIARMTGKPRGTIAALISRRRAQQRRDELL